MTEAKQTLQERAQAALYPGKSPGAKPAPRAGEAATKFDKHADHASRLYGSPYNHALESFHARFEGKHREDREALQKSREARALHEKFFTELKMDPLDATTGMGRLLEYEDLPRSTEDQQKIADRTFETLRLELGSTEKATEMVQDHLRFLSAYKAAVPYFAERATAHGAQVDPEIVRIGALYGAALPK